MASEPATADVWNRFADGGRALLVGAAVVAPLWRKDIRTGVSGLTAIIATYAASKTIKTVWREPRPNGQNDKSFPSEHAGDCFAAATILDQEWRNSLGPLGIGLATAVSMARVFSGKHHIADVVAGAALGVIAGEIAGDYRV
ncbi:MAG TPA: phosphatase PAP2 family protein [Sphingomicrobium sp.]|nr:phosphatase PAP2 family protein [Sphingomicrobium sp.]